MNQEVYFENIRSIILEELDKCQTSLKIAVAWFTDATILYKIEQLMEKNISVSIIIYDDHINKKDIFKNIYYKQAKIHLSKKMMHNKFCIIDDDTVINGSYNWTLNASSNNENITITHGNIQYASKFNNQFKILLNQCVRIDTFFDYSNEKIEILCKEFEFYLSQRKNYKFPYFLNCENPTIHQKNSMYSFKKGIYLVCNEIEEREILWLIYFLESQNSVSKLKNVLKKNITLPQRFDFVDNTLYDSNNVNKLIFRKILVEQHIKHRKVYFAFFLDNTGKISGEKVQFREKLPNGYYLSYFYKSKTEIYDKNLIPKTLDIIKPEVHQQIGIICSCRNPNLGKEFKYGVLDFTGEKKIDFKFDSYKIIEDEHLLKLIEYPYLMFKKGENLYFYSKPYTDYRLLPHKVSKYYFNEISPNMDSKKVFPSEKDNDEVVFLSDDEDMREFLITIKENEHNYPYINLRMLTFEKFSEYRSEFLKSTNKYAPNYFTSLNYKLQLKDKIDKSSKRGKYEEKEEGCYIATMIYGSYNDSNVIILRKFRDNHLNKHLWGRYLIKIYYSISPFLVTKLQNKQLINKFLKKILDWVIAKLKYKHHETQFKTDL